MSKDSKERVRALYVSDLHLGSPACHCSKFLDFLEKYEFEELYLAGDIFDADALRRNYKWTNCYTEFISRIIRLGKSKKVYYIPGNHDSFMRDFIGECIKDLCVYRDIVVQRGDQNFLVIHGDEIDPEYFSRNHLYSLGGRIYGALLWVNRQLCRLRLGCDWAKLAKRKSKRATNFVLDFEKKAADLAKEKGCDKVILGHVHIPEIKTLEDITYMNCGDWVENCSGLVEDLDGNFRIDYYDSVGLRGPELLEQR